MVLRLAALASLALSCSGEPSASTPRAPREDAPPAATVSPAADVDPLPRPRSDAVVKRITLGEAGLDERALDRTTSPCESLYQHACGGWIASFRMPDDKVTYERSFSRGTDETRARLRALLEGTDPSSPALAALRDFYRSCMDEATITSRGLSPITGHLRSVDAAKTKTELASALGAMYPFVDAFVSFGTQPSPTYTAMRVAWFGPGGTRGAPPLEAFAGDAPESVAKRDVYQAHAEQMLVLARKSQPAAERIARDAIRIERQLALAAIESQAAPAARRRDPHALAALESAAGGFPWAPTFAAAGLTRTEAIQGDMAYARRVAEIYASSTLDELKGYATWRVVRDTARVLGRGFADERWRYREAIWGKGAREPRWSTCVASTNAVMRDALTREYVSRHFSEETRSSFAAMFGDFVTAFDERMRAGGFLDDATRTEARAKLAAMEVRIGHPEVLRDHTTPVRRDRYAENVLAAEAATGRRWLRQVGEPVDRRDWYRNPLETNAFVDNRFNVAVFPVGFLQPPMYDAKSTLPVRYGAIGFHLGHEMTHAFDDQGARHDAQGNLVDWWSPASWAAFEARLGCLRDQFAAYPPIQGVRVDPKRTLGENVADLGGLTVAFRAYRNARKDAREVTVAGGYTEDQQFFLAHAQDMCVVFGDDDLKGFLATNVHAPHWLRVDAVAANMPEFTRAFGCEAPVKRCVVW